MTLGGAALHLALRACPPLRAVQVPIWKKEVYEGESASWKENKESAAPTIGQAAAKATGQGGGASTRMALVGAAVALGVLALSSAALRKRS